MLKMFSICAALSFPLVSSAMAQSRACAEDIKKTCANIKLLLGHHLTSTATRASLY